ncbi:hypothetical protein E2C01_102465 [Portunus trituberculatus]|uniref:Uncharacterized protein n=1 Tax=Portunus trituberculatus TaxID=210409 RepID=A0A5B7KCP3_PORTR|nr:hypothetical protein [Portunus trituberculatus]
MKDIQILSLSLSLELPLHILLGVRPINLLLWLLLLHDTVFPVDSQDICLATYQLWGRIIYVKLVEQRGCAMGDYMVMASLNLKRQRINPSPTPAATSTHTDLPSLDLKRQRINSPSTVLSLLPTDSPSLCPANCFHFEVTPATNCSGPRSLRPPTLVTSASHPGHSGLPPWSFRPPTLVIPTSQPGHSGASLFTCENMINTV